VLARVFPLTDTDRPRLLERAEASVHIDKAKFLLFAGSIATGACILRIDDKKSGTSGSGGGSTSATSASSATEGAATTSTGGACDDSQGTPGDCAKIMSSCGEGSGLTVCNNAKSIFKPKIAEAAVACMLPADCAGSSSLYHNCAMNALAAACPDATADATCATWVSMCAGVGATSEGCHAALDGLTAAARKDVVLNCTCAAGLDACVQLKLGM
jgi:hypothetical protein